ncbi:MAG: iron ABC transporter permease [Legionellales bacterium]|nr:iron ABC transporter permease [Legionellales bacterium]
MILSNFSYYFQKKLNLKYSSLKKSGPSLVLVLISLFFCIPVFIISGSLFLPFEGVWVHLVDTVLTDYMLNSFLLLIGVGFFSLLLSVIPAWLVTMYKFPASNWLQWAILLPMAMPAYIIAYSYTGALDAAGPVQATIRDLTGLGYSEYWFPEIRSLGGAITMLSLVLYPYIYLLARATFAEQSVCVLEVSRTLGCNTMSAFRRVALPLARPAIIVGLSLVLMETLADYGTVQYFGVSAFTTGIFKTWFGMDSSLAAAQLSALLLLFVFVFLFLERRSRKLLAFHHTSNRYSPLLKQELRGIRAFFAFFVCFTPLLFGFIIPIGFLVGHAIEIYSGTIDYSFIRLLSNSILLALITSFLALFVALFLGYINRNNFSFINKFLIRFISLGYAVPGTVIAIGVLIPFAWFDNRLDNFLLANFNVSSGLLISGTLFILIFAYLVRFITIPINTVEAALEKIKPGIDEVAKTNGMSHFNIMRKIHMPIMKGSLLTCSLLVFVDVLKELPATLILRPFNFNTLAVRTFELANEERLADAAVPALAIVVAGIIPVIMISNSISRSRPGYE